MAKTPAPSRTAATGAATLAERASYKVIGPLRHGEVVDGELVEDDYPPGSTIELTEAQAAPLLGHTVKPAKA